VKKAKLDILEDLPDLKSEGTAPAGVQDPTAAAGRGWAINKLFLVAAPVVLVLALVAGYAALQLGGHFSPGAKSGEHLKRPEIPAPAAPAVKETAPAAASGQATTLALDDFIIDLQDARGRHFMVLVDIALQLQGEAKHKSPEEIAAARAVVIRTLQGKNVVALRSPEERRKLKEDLARALEEAMGAVKVQDVFFTNYFIL